MKAALLLCAAASLFAQDPVFRTGVSLVRVDAEAVDAGGKVIEGLKQDDFRVLDEGMPQTLVNFGFAVDPLDLILLFDTSGGMHGKLLSLVRTTQLGFNELHRGDRVSVRAFSNYSNEFLPFSEDLTAVNVAILTQVIPMKFSGASKFEAAADEAAMRFRQEVKTRRKRAVLIVTDKAGARGSNEATTVRDFWNSDAILSELILGASGMNQIVDKTGGISIAASTDPTALGAAFRDSVHYLRSGYTMYYQMPAVTAGTERHLEVGLSEEAARRFPGVKVHARSGYIVP